MKKVENISLNGEWTLIQKENSINIPSQVPGSVFEALIKNKIIEDPFYGENEHQMVWVYDSDWIYEYKFDVDILFFQHDNILLLFNGLDTVSEVHLNGEFLGATDNMFRVHDFEVKSKLKRESNVLKVILYSPSKKALEAVKKYKERLMTTNSGIGAPYLRKAQYSFGWDWGPALPDIGIWKSVELIGYDGIKLNSIYPVQEFKYTKDPLKIVNPEDIFPLMSNRSG